MKNKRIPMVILSESIMDVCITLNGKPFSSSSVVSLNRTGRPVDIGPMHPQTDRPNSIAISRAMLLMWQKNKQVSMERNKTGIKYSYLP